jgi:hypothetical protein
MNKGSRSFSKVYTVTAAQISALRRKTVIGLSRNCVERTIRDTRHRKRHKDRQDVRTGLDIWSIQTCSPDHSALPMT